MTQKDKEIIARAAGVAVGEVKDNLTVWGHLNLGGTGITSLPENLTVGGYLYLDSSAITSLPDNLTVGGYLYLEGTGITDTSNVNKDAPQIFYWRNKKYIKVDGVFSELISQRGHVMRVRMIGKKEISYIVTDGKNFAHGATLKEAKEDLVYKVTDRRKDDFKSLNAESVLSHSEAIACYRTITGACSFGTRDFCENRLKKQKTYTVKEIARLTAGEYGHDTFTKFFNL